MISHKKVARIMREKHCSYWLRRKRWGTTTRSNPGLAIYPKLIKGLTIRHVNQLWGADTTYIRILTRFVYLTVILDAFSRKPIGYALSRSLDIELTLAALQMAISDRHPEPGCIHRSDRNVQCASSGYAKEFEPYGFQISMSRKGNFYDNAHAESSIKTLNSEEVGYWSAVPWRMSRKGFPIFSRTCITRCGFTPVMRIGLLVSLKQWQW